MSTTKTEMHEGVQTAWNAIRTIRTRIRDRGAEGWPSRFESPSDWTPPLINRVSKLFGLPEMFEFRTDGKKESAVAFRLMNRGIALLSAVSAITEKKWSAVTGLGKGPRTCLCESIVRSLPPKDRFGHDSLWHAMSEDCLPASMLKQLLDAGCSLEQKGVPVGHDLLTQSCLWGEKGWHTDEAVLDLLAETGMDFRISRSDIPDHPFLDEETVAARIALGEAIHARSRSRRGSDCWDCGR